MTESKRQRARELRRALTPAERVLWNVLRHDALGVRFRRQMPIRGFIVDFACPRARLVVEVDGPVHDEQTAYDRERDRALALDGYRVLRVTNDDVTHALAAVLERIRTALPSATEEGRVREPTFTSGDGGNARRRNRAALPSATEEGRVREPTSTSGDGGDARRR